jgi:O-antigen ligase
MTTKALESSLVPGVAPASDERIETTTTTGEQAKLAFAFLWLFTFVGFGRPEDLLSQVGLLHLTLVSALLALTAYLGALFTGRARLLRSANLLLVLLLTGWFVLGLPFAYYRAGSFGVFTQEWLRTLIFFFLLTQTLTSIGRVRKILWAVALSELMASLASILLQGKPALDQGDRLSGVNQGLLGWNFLGITLSVTLPFLAALYVSKRSAPKTILLIATLGSTMWMLILTASRGGFLGILLSIVLTWCFVLRGSSRGRVLTALILIGLIVVLGKAPEVFWSRLETTLSNSASADSSASWAENGNDSGATKSDVESAEQSTKGRERLLENSVKYTARFPVFGLGIGGFPTYNGEAVHRADAWLGTHNTFTQISSECGIPALVLFLCLLFMILGRMKKLSAQFADDVKRVELRLLARATFVSTLMFAFQGFFAHIAYGYLFYFIAGIAAGLCAIARRDTEEDDAPDPFEAITSSIWCEVSQQ